MRRMDGWVGCPGRAPGRLLRLDLGGVTMSESLRSERLRMTRRAALRGAAVAGATLAAGLGAGGRVPSVHAQWRPRDDVRAGYEAALSRPARHYQVWAYDQLRLGLGEHVVNSLNASQF